MAASLTRKNDMARARDQKNGRLEEALADLVRSQTSLVQSEANLVQTQALFVQNHEKFLAEKAETDRRMAEYERTTDARFAQIEATLAELIRLLERLPEAVREKIGFKAPA